MGFIVARCYWRQSLWRLYLYRFYKICSRKF